MWCVAPIDFTPDWARTTEAGGHPAIEVTPENVVR